MLSYQVIIACPIGIVNSPKQWSVVELLTEAILISPVSLPDLVSLHWHKMPEKSYGCCYRIKYNWPNEASAARQHVTDTCWERKAFSKYPHLFSYFPPLFLIQIPWGCLTGMRTIKKFAVLQKRREKEMVKLSFIPHVFPSSFIPHTTRRQNKHRVRATDKWMAVSEEKTSKEGQVRIEEEDKAISNKKRQLSH